MELMLQLHTHTLATLMHQQSHFPKVFSVFPFFLLIFNNPNILYCKGLPLAYAYAPQASIAVHAAAHPAIAYAAHPAAVSVHAAPAVVHAPAVVAAAPA